MSVLRPEGGESGAGARSGPRAAERLAAGPASTSASTSGDELLDAASLPPVLIADDDATSRRLLELTVAEWGYTPLSASDGAQALAKLSAPEGPKLAVLDWEMPAMTGPQVCRILRARHSTPYVYLILLTGRDARSGMVTGLSAGADDYLCKPFDKMELRLRLRAGQRIVALQHELLSAREELERRANHDGLTGAYNRTAMVRRIEEESSRSHRRGEPFSLILTDLDHFKRINDEYGHTAGDAVLKEAVRRFDAAMRPYDVLGRYGGEEFLVLLPDCDRASGVTVAERLRRSLADKAVQTSKGLLKVTASFGVVCSDHLYPSLSQMVDAADDALYRAKAAGRDRIEMAGDFDGDTEPLEAGPKSFDAGAVQVPLVLHAPSTPAEVELFDDSGAELEPGRRVSGRRSR